jgi:hypothetical protein
MHSLFIYISMRMTRREQDHTSSGDGLRHSDSAWPSKTVCHVPLSLHMKHRKSGLTRACCVDRCDQKLWLHETCTRAGYDRVVNTRTCAMKQSQCEYASDNDIFQRFDSADRSCHVFILGSGLAPPANKIQEPNIGRSHRGT